MISPLSRTLRGALLALALMALGPVTGAMAAPALKVPAAPSVTAAAQALGATHWQRERVRRAGRDHLGAPRDATNAESRWSSAVGADPSTYLRCTIAFSLDVHWDWPKFCTITEHELGHLTGHAHVDDDADLMSPYYFGASPECQRAPAPPARHGRLVVARASSRSSAAPTRSRRATARGAPPASS